MSEVRHRRVSARVRPRTLHVVTNLDVGGSQLSVTGIAAGLVEHGWEVHVAYSSAGGQGMGRGAQLPVRLAEAGVTLHDIKCMTRDARPMLDFRAYRDLRALIGSIRPHIVHTHMSKAGILARFAASAERECAVLHTVRGWSYYAARTSFRRMLYVGLERLAARGTHCMLSVAQPLIDDGLANGIGNRRRYRVIRSGIDVIRFRQPSIESRTVRLPSIPDNTRIVGCVMSLVEAKASDVFVEVATAVLAEQPDVHFVIAGDGPQRSMLERLIRDTVHGDRIHLLGHRHDVPELLQCFDLFLLTSRWEGLPRVLIEACAAGVPCVATDVGGVRDLIRRGETGLLGVSSNPAHLASLVLNLLEDPALARQLGRNAERQVDAHHDMKIVVREHLALYEKIMCDPDAI